MAGGAKRLTGRRVLVVEDSYTVAYLVSATLRDAGATIVGPASTLQQALDLLDEGRVDLAVLDIDLGAADVYPLVERLRDRFTPVIYTTGIEREDIPERFRENCQLLNKPVIPEELIEAARRALM